MIDDADEGIKRKRGYIFDVTYFNMFVVPAKSATLGFIGGKINIAGVAPDSTVSVGVFSVAYCFDQGFPRKMMFIDVALKAVGVVAKNRFVASAASIYSCSFLGGRVIRCSSTTSGAKRST